MKKYYFLIAIIIIMAHNIMPQDSPFYDAPFGGGGGYTGGWIVPNVDGINVQLKNFGVPSLPSNGLYMSGGAGFIYLGFIKNLRVGGMGYSGSRTTSAISYPIYATPLYPYPSPIYNDAVYSISGGGLTLEYTLPFVKDFGVSVGAVIGRGSLNIQLYSNIGTITWRNYWYRASGSSSNLKNSFWLFNPTLNVDIPAYHLLSFRIGAGYQYTFGSSWTYDNNKDITDAPSNINGNSFYIQAGIFVGLFSY
jgi:hypothetical protein